MCRRKRAATTISPVNTDIAVDDWSQPMPFLTNVPPWSSVSEENAAVVVSPFCVTSTVASSRLLVPPATVTV